jgi:hypothetical protein
MIEEILLRSLDAMDWLQRHFEARREWLSKRNVLLFLVLLMLLILYAAGHSRHRYKHRAKGTASVTYRIIPASSGQHTKAIAIDVTDIQNRNGHGNDNDPA